MKLTVKEIQAWLNRFAEEIKEKKAYLSDLDTPIGDGDHGNNMGRGVTAYEAKANRRHLTPSVIPSRCSLWRSFPK